VAATNETHRMNRLKGVMRNVYRNQFPVTSSRFPVPVRT
jgi:hypothetical protein